MIDNFGKYNEVGIPLVTNRNVKTYIRALIMTVAPVSPVSPDRLGYSVSD